MLLAEKIVEPYRNKNKTYYYHRQYRRVPEIDECDVNDHACFMEANAQFKRDKWVQGSSVKWLLCQAPPPPMLWHHQTARLHIKVEYSPDERSPLFCNGLSVADGVSLYYVLPVRMWSYTDHVLTLNTRSHQYLFERRRVWVESAFDISVVHCFQACGWRDSHYSQTTLPWMPDLLLTEWLE